MKSHRQFELLLLLLDHPSGLSQEEIAARIPAFAEGSKEAAAKRLERDLKELEEIGIPVRSLGGRHLVDHARWRMDDLELTEDESHVIALAGGARFREPSLQKQAERAWRKIAGVASRSDLRSTRARSLIADPMYLTAEDVGALQNAWSTGRRVTFWHVPQYGVPDKQRILEPWGIVNIGGRNYLVGYDIHRDGPRSYRLNRITSVEPAGDAFHPRPSADALEELARGVLRRGEATVRAVVRVKEDTCPEVTRNAEMLPDAHWLLPDLTLPEIIEIGLNHAGDLVIVEPQQARDKVVQTLKEIVDAYE